MGIPSLKPENKHLQERNEYLLNLVREVCLFVIFSICTVALNVNVH